MAKTLRSSYWSVSPGINSIGIDGANSERNWSNWVIESMEKLDLFFAPYLILFELEVDFVSWDSDSGSNSEMFTESPMITNFFNCCALSVSIPPVRYSANKSCL
ncbi:hypothetical protein WICPIJ_002269 [Wickerhamomyces pijperi]|uniref:Uncharacterized protein n=1 Tax=Wickerhamomyces pijperi TaxID=599730 RepID=A0A9P8Q9A3_WICPI|nr:hypothetical protein WICPIJ_002269 [Wickerhamomyces pijperi]